jgi:hypothetical protein
MLSLRDLQQELGRSLLVPSDAAVLGPGFQTYVGNVFGNWVKALACAYPIARQLVGEPFFEGLARAYAVAHPSPSGDLNEFGAHFPAFVARYPQTQDLPYLPDVAKMEWLAHRAHFAADPPRFDPARLAGIPPAQYGALPLRLAPGSCLLHSAWPLARIWEIHQEGYAGELSVDFSSPPGRFLVFRPAWRVTVESLALGDCRFLAAANIGATLGEALEAAAAADPQFDCASALARWMAKGVLTL